MFDRRNIEITAGNLSLGLENLFDNIEESKVVRLYINQVEQLELHHGTTTTLCVQLDADELDQLAKAWLEKRRGT